MASNTDQNFAQNLRRLRERAGLRQAELVDRLRANGLGDWHPTTLSRTETGERPVRLSEAWIIADVLGTSLSEMVKGASVVDRALDDLTIEIERVQAQRNSFYNTRAAYIQMWNRAWQEWQELSSFETDESAGKRLSTLKAVLRGLEPTEWDSRASQGLLEEQRERFAQAAIADRAKASLDRPFSVMTKAEREALLVERPEGGSYDTEA